MNTHIPSLRTRVLPLPLKIPMFTALPLFPRGNFLPYSVTYFLDFLFFYLD